MPEHETIDITAEDVSQLTWDELVLVMTGKNRADAAHDPIRAIYYPPCTTQCCTYCAGCSGCLDHGCIDG
jgi:hypothetical protein